MGKFPFFLFAILGILLFIIGLVYLINKISLVKHGKIISGTVIDLREDYVNNKKAYFPVIKYYDDNGQRKSFKSEAGFSRLKYAVGDNVGLRYYRQGLKDVVCINTVFALYGVSLISIPIGLLFSIIGILGEIYSGIWFDWALWFSL